MSKKYRNYKWLYDNYIVNNRSVTSIAEEYSVTKRTIYNWLEYYNISIKQKHRKPRKLQLMYLKSC